MKSEAPLVVLLHGHMGLPSDLEPFARSLGVEGRFVFPEGFVDLSPHGLHGRAWWSMDGGATLDGQPAEESESTSRPPLVALGEARAHVDRQLDDLERALGPRPLVVGGFSQGAMLACDLVLQGARPVAGLALFSGARIAESDWRPFYAARAGLPAFMSHGRNDTDLSFAEAHSLQRELAAAGWQVTWCPFDGGHEIPLVVWRSFKRWLTSLR